MNIGPIKSKVIEYLEKHGLTKKFNKQLSLLQTDFRHPSLHTELLAPKEHGIRSFRIDRSFRALFFYDSETDSIQILAITNHYQ